MGQRVTVPDIKLRKVSDGLAPLVMVTACDASRSLIADEAYKLSPSSLQWPVRDRANRSSDTR